MEGGDEGKHSGERDIWAGGGASPGGPEEGGEQGVPESAVAAVATLSGSGQTRAEKSVEDMKDMLYEVGAAKRGPEARAAA